MTSLSPYEWSALAASAVVLGMQKTGLQGVVMLVIPLLATIFGGRASAGLLLPMLSMADMAALYYYHRTASWKHVLRVLPTTVAGIVIGTALGASIPDDLFLRVIGAVIVLSLLLMVYSEYVRKDANVPEWWWFSPAIGLAGGFATMVGNASTVIMALYLLSMRLPKEHYIGTGAWFFFLINIIKMPFHILVWGTITLDTLAINALVAPLILVGAMIGVRLVRRVPEKPYRAVIIIVTFISSLRLFF
ncbi:MAG: sulfite exporter TauE/SafE family protein [Spirochaetaceae bacterium]|nr:MAG: sulfite exporter TauE/SafE family protein [Spirochaetaceae bacterium]